MGEERVEFSEHRFPETGRSSPDDAFDDPSDRVVFLSDRFDESDHRGGHFPIGTVEDRIGIFPIALRRDKAAHLDDSRLNRDSPFGQKLFRQRSGGDPGTGFPPA